MTIFVAALLGLAPTAQALSCSLQGVAGRYGYTISGVIPALGAVAAVGHSTRLEGLDRDTGSHFAGTSVDEAGEKQERTRARK